MEGNNAIYVEGDVLHFDQNHEFDTFSIYNLSGQLMRTGVHENEIDISHLAMECMCCSKKSKTFNQRVLLKFRKGTWKIRPCKVCCKYSGTFYFTNKRT